MKGTPLPLPPLEVLVCVEQIECLHASRVSDGRVQSWNSIQGACGDQPDFMAWVEISLGAPIGL